jgi:hypothetical protein
VPAFDRARFDEGASFEVLAVYVCENSCGGDGESREVVVAQLN